MADATKQIAIEILVQRDDEAKKKVAYLEREIAKLTRSTSQADKNMLKFAKEGLVLAKKQARETALELKAVRKGMDDTRKSTGYLGTSIAYLASDMGFFAQNPRMGLMAIGNNLSQVAIGMQVAAQRAGSLGKALKVALATQGWMIALQLGISLLSNAGTLMKYFKSETDKAADALKKLNQEFENFVKQVEENNTELKEANDLFDEQIEKFIRMSNNISANGIDRDSDYYKAWVDLKQVIEDTYNLKIDFTKPGWEDRLKETIGPLRKKVDEILQEEASNRISSILGLSSKSETLSAEAETQIKKNALKYGLTISKATELYWKSPKGRIMAAKITKAQQDEETKAYQDGIKAQMKTRAEYLKKIMREDDEIQQLLIEAWTPDTVTQKEKWQAEAKRILAVIKDSMNLSDPEITAMKPDDLASALGVKKEELDNSPEAVDRRQQEINKIKKRNRKADLDSYMDYAHQTASVGADLIQAAQQANPKNKKLAKASIIANAAVATLGTWKQWLADPGGPLGPIGNPIAAALQAAGIWITAKSAMNQVDNESANAGGAGGGKPQFNIIGQSQNNALQATIEEQTGILGNAAKDNKVYVLQSDLQAANEERQVAVEQTSL